MEIRINIECENINQFYAHLKELERAIKRTAKKQKLNPLEDEFSKEHESNFDDNNCYGSHSVNINDDGAIKEAQELFLKFIPTKEYGENADAERLWDIVFGNEIKVG